MTARTAQRPERLGRDTVLIVVVVGPGLWVLIPSPVYVSAPVPRYFLLLRDRALSY